MRTEPIGRFFCSIRDYIKGLAFSMLAAGLVMVSPGLSEAQSPATMPTDPKILQAEFDAIVAQKKDDPSIKALADRLAAIEEATRVAETALAGSRGKALDEIVQTAPGRAPAAKPVEITPADLLGRFGRRFAVPIPPMPIADPQREHLRELYKYRVNAAVEQLSVQAVRIAAVNASRAENAFGLALIPLWLSIPDDEWSFATTNLLPERLCKQHILAICERAALSARRPCTAFSFGLHADNKSESDATPAAFITYVRKATPVLTRNKRYDDALACLAAGTKAAHAVDTATADEIALDYAQLLSDVNRPVDAATALKPLVDGKHDRPSFGRAVVLRLKFLYQANDHKSVMAEYRPFLDYPETKDFAPQILYIAWCAARQAQPDLESRLRKEFLDNFPTNPLGADIYFSTAMQALTASDYAEARRVLEYIEFRYPNSPLMPRVKEIQAKLASIASSPRTKDGK